jgi:hypothetical protein
MSDLTPNEQLLLFIIRESSLDVERELEGSWCGDYDLGDVLMRYDVLKREYDDLTRAAQVGDADE